jgi:hypothetical protein
LNIGQENFNFKEIVMSTSTEQAEIDAAVLELEQVAVTTKAVSGRLDSWLNAQGYDKKAAEVFLEYLNPKDQEKFINFIKERFPVWKDKNFTLQEFMNDEANGYKSKTFKDDLSSLKAENTKQLETVNLAKLQVPVGFERFFNGTCTELLHSAHPGLEIKQRKGDNGVDQTTFKENRVQALISVVEEYNTRAPVDLFKTILIACEPLITSLSGVESFFPKALQKAESPIRRDEGPEEHIGRIQDEIAALKESVITAAQGTDDLFKELCDKHPTDTQLSDTANTFSEMVSEPLTPLPVMHIPESPESSPRSVKEKLGDVLGALGNVGQSGEVIDGAVIAAAGAVANAASTAANKVANKTSAAASKLILRFSPKAAKKPESPPASPSSGKTPGKPGPGA